MKWELNDKQTNSKNNREMPYGLWQNFLVSTVALRCLPLWMEFNSVFQCWFLMSDNEQWQSSSDLISAAEPWTNFSWVTLHSEANLILILLVENHPRISKAYIAILNNYVSFNVLCLYIFLFVLNFGYLGCLMAGDKRLLLDALRGSIQSRQKLLLKVQI